MQVLAVIADVVGSRELPRRELFQRRLARVLEERRSGARHLASPYTITLGDEFQAVYRGAETVFADVVKILAAIHPVRARFAVGLGPLSTRLNPRAALGMDGPAFHRARAALTALKADGGLLRVAGPVEEPWALTNHTLNWLSHHLAGWRQNRLEVLAGLLRGESVRELEAALRISRVAVYKNIRSAALDDVAGICHEITRALDRALRDS
jgi:hypothetical protein